jgi:hypothetical protein
VSTPSGCSLEWLDMNRVMKEYPAGPATNPLSYIHRCRISVVVHYHICTIAYGPVEEAKTDRRSVNAENWLMALSLTVDYLTLNAVAELRGVE